MNSLKKTTGLLVPVLEHEDLLISRLDLFSQNNHVLTCARH